MKVLRVHLTRAAWNLTMVTAHDMHLVATAVGLPVGGDRRWCEFTFGEWDQIMATLADLDYSQPRHERFYLEMLALEVSTAVDVALDTVGADR